MSTHPGFADGDPAPETDDQPTAQYPVGFGEDPTTQLTAKTPPVAPPPNLDSPGNATAGLMTAASSDRCNNCGAQLAPDQHYCVVCGERRGRARFAGAMFGPTGAPAGGDGVPAAGGAQGRATRWPPATTLIAGIATLLVAVGLGILIGHDSSNNKAAAAQPKVNVTVNGGGGSGAGSSTGASTSTTASSNSTSNKSTKATATSTKAAPKVSAAAAQKSAAAASKVLGSSSKNAPPPTVQQGQACAHGAGCSGGKFTGNFFGG